MIFALQISSFEDQCILWNGIYVMKSALPLRDLHKFQQHRNSPGHLRLRRETSLKFQMPPLSEGFKTADLIGDDGKNLSTEEMGNQIIQEIKGSG